MGAPDPGLLSSRASNLVDAVYLLPERSEWEETEREVSRMPDSEHCKVRIRCHDLVRNTMVNSSEHFLNEIMKQGQGKLYFHLFQPSDFLLETLISFSE